MIYIYGDSHARFSFAGLKMPHKNYSENSITMHRIGRDNKIINFNAREHDMNSIVCLVYGEVDCRCHVKRQMLLGREEDDIIHELVEKYFISLKGNIHLYKKVIIVGVIPPTRQNDYEKIHGPIRHEFPFIGTDEERVRFTTKVNKRIEELCAVYGYIYFNPYGFYTNDDGTLCHSLSDTTVHLGNTHQFNEDFEKLILRITS